MAEKITVVGAGVSGKALAHWAKDQGAQVFVTDRKEIDADTCSDLAQAGIAWESGGHSVGCCHCDRMILSSGIGPHSEAVVMAQQRGIPLMGEIDFLAPYLTGRLIAVTGTNGKTTVTSLIGHLLRSNGLDAAVVGNIGEPLAHCAGRRYDAVAMELSSFQLYWNRTLTPHTAVVTNLAPDHLDWHGTFEHYQSSKGHVFGRPSGGCWAIVQDRDRSLVPPGGSLCTLGGSQGVRISWNSDEVTLHLEESRRKLFSRGQLKLLGRHNLENAAMACAAVALTFPELDPSAGLEDFSPLPHRCQLVGRWRSVTYVDDSKGTNVASTCTALQGLEGPKVVILGGQGKGETYDLLAQVVKDRARAAILLGAESAAIEKSLIEEGYRSYHRVDSMEEAVQRAIALAQPGDTVLLSPACTSWDMYRNYGERGNHFSSLVRESFR